MKQNTQIYKLDDSFCESVKIVTTFVQFLALMPVSGTMCGDPSKLKFTWKSIRVIFTLIYISYGIVLTSLFFMFIYTLGISAKNIGDFSF